ncbi:MAG: sulfate permease [Gemmatimonadota bacterium]|nr:sulfate permease [Gemmatimonadota bacterium]
MLVPKLFTTLRSYDRAQLTADVTAGVIVGIVALPLAIAFAIASGLTPDRGLWTAIIAGFVISLLGGSRVQIGGPTGAFVVIVYGIVQKYGVEGLTVATLMAGVILVFMGVARLGGAIKFIPQPVVTGFTSGIAVLIFSGELKDFLGLRMGAVPVEFFAKWRSLAAHIGSVTPSAVAIAVTALLILVLWPRVSRRVPAPFVALVATTAIATYFHLPIETIGSRFGAISAALPAPVIPHLTFTQVQALIGPAFTIAMLGAMESLLSAVVADGMIGGRHRSNMELIGQGIANLITPLFGGMPATGAIARTATNVKNGGRTPVAGIVHSLTLLVITLVAGRWAALIPMTTLAAILIVVSVHMSEWRVFRSELHSPRSDVAVLITTFLLTVVVDLTVAIEVGMVLAAFLFMRRMAEVTSVVSVTRELDDADGDEARDPGSVRRRAIPAGVQVYEISGPFFFGAAETFKDTIARVAGAPEVLIIRMRAVPALDATGLRALRDVVVRSRRDGTLVLLSEVHMQPLVALSRSHAMRDIGEQNVFDDLDLALARAAAHVNGPASSRARVAIGAA